MTLVSKKPGLTITFDIREAMADDYTDEETEEPPEGQSDSVTVPFVAEFKKGDDVLRFECLASETVTIETVKYLPNGSTDPNIYGGPTFEELDGELQDSFHEYLSTNGVDDSIATFITLYADYKEQLEYVKWLGDVKALVK